jgi:hypothetical protein
MTTRALLTAAGLFAAGLTPAFADSITAAVLSWNPSERTLTLEDYSQIANIAATVSVPEIKPGDVITVDYLGSENGYDTITSITVNRDVAKRVLPRKRG